MEPTLLLESAIAVFADVGGHIYPRGQSSLLAGQIVFSAVENLKVAIR
jgi:hypothetical protein